jgi:hypothetical protein
MRNVRVMPVGEDIASEALEPEVLVRQKPGSNEPPEITIRVVREELPTAEEVLRMRAHIARILLNDEQRKASLDERQGRAVERSARWARTTFGWGVGVGFLILIAIETALLQLARC